MFYHGYNSYMHHAFPADELMPLTCSGRVRGVTPSRGDVDDSLGHYSLTLVDSLDTLVVLGNITAFVRAMASRSCSDRPQTAAALSLPGWASADLLRCCAALGAVSRVPLAGGRRAAGFGTGVL